MIIKNIDNLRNSITEVLDKYFKNTPKNKEFEYNKTITEFIIYEIIIHE
ncbi:hypothetical protein LCGC14_1544530 [marine sediment metagenome]|uniref:Uncharacterized protein n=1 Tax=marine sediment metagenome TaxID=412755 RepID=A0A0F9L860_9ZZZZ